ncbi:MAG TPA: prolyl oligopeptidase family serine peptidase [Phycisphaerales bacterium]|nr:prolyl oligopeptidase family serine peptidase [Phycisphaerales bacterium]
MRTRLSLILAAAGLVSVLPCAHAQPTTATAPKQQASKPSVATFMKIRAPGAPRLTPDGKMYVRDWPNGIWQLFRVEGKEARPDSKMTQLTHFGDGLAGYSMSKDATKALLLHATGGNENNQISLMDMKTGQITPVAHNPKVQHAVQEWLNDDSGLIYSANDESPNDFYLYRHDFKDGKKTKLLGRPGSWSAGDVTDDASRVLVGEYRSSSDSSIYELDTKTGKLNDLTVKPQEGTVSVGWVGYMPGDNAVLFESDIEDGMKKLFLRDLKTGEITKPISELDQFEIDGAGMNREKTLLAVVTNEDGYGVLHVYHLPSFKKAVLPEIPKGVTGIGQLDGNLLVYSVNNAQVPGLAFAYEVPGPDAKAANKPRQITFADTQGIDLSQFPLPELVKVKSFDGLEVPCFVYVPAGYQKGTRIPFVVNYHGGPEGQFRPTFDRAVQYLLSEGFGVIQPNVRGSSGYGRKFLMMDDYKKRWDSVKDGVAAAQWLVDNGYATPGKMSTYGGSYGGFMSVACLVEDQNQVDAGARKERLFGAGINVVGIVNMKTFLEQTAGYRRKLREVEYGPLTDPEFLATVSSMNYVDKINVPIYIAHGFNDPRVPVGEAMQLAVALKEKAAKGDPRINPHLWIAPDEGHGFQKLNNRLYFAEYMAKFLKETIGQPEQPAAAKK